MKIGIVQIYNDQIKKYSIYSQMINSFYAKKHGYTYISWDYDLVPKEYSCYYNKIKAVYEALKSNFNFDWILYLDTDAIITNDKVKIEDIIYKHGNYKNFIFTKDANGFNNGVFLIKNTPLAEQFLQACYEDSAFFHTPMPEQNAMYHYACQEEYKTAVGWETMYFLNAYIAKYANMEYDEPLWDSNSFVLHLQKIPDEQRISVFKEFLQYTNVYLLSSNDQ